MSMAKVLTLMMVEAERKRKIWLVRYWALLVSTVVVLGFSGGYEKENKDSGAQRHPIRSFRED